MMIVGLAVILRLKDVGVEQNGDVGYRLECNLWERRRNLVEEEGVLALDELVNVGVVGHAVLTVKSPDYYWGEIYAFLKDVWKGLWEVDCHVDEWLAVAEHRIELKTWVVVVLVRGWCKYYIINYHFFNALKFRSKIRSLYFIK